MIDDPLDRQPGDEKRGRRRDPWRPSWRDLALVAVTAILSSMATYLYFAPLMLRVRHLEELRLVPNVHVEVIESPGERDGEIDFTIHLANLGPKAVDILVMARPLPDWVAFTDRSAVKVFPARPVEAHVGRDRATVRLMRPLEAGSYASITLSSIKFTPTEYGYGAHAMHLYIYADNREQMIKYYGTMPRPRGGGAAGPAPAGKRPAGP